VLKRALVLLAVATSWVALGESDDGVKAPVRVTVGLADQLLGQLSPDAGRLYYVSTLRTASEVSYQEPPGGRARNLFDESADVTWPRLSPDGQRLAYVSLGEHATGQLCVRELPAADQRRCLAEPVGALQAEWIGNERLGLVVRDSIQGDLRLLEVAVGKTLTAKPLPQRNLVSPTFSADGRWMVSVPISRYSPEVGPGFAASASTHLEAHRMNEGHASPPVPFTLDLPGVTAQPALSRDGRWLYVVQFIHDSDHDGKVDALDHGVLFRVPFDVRDDDAPNHAAAAVPEQLTDGSWNCQYPAPALTTLVASCSQGDNVDVHEVPLDGLVPRAWSPDRIKQEVELVPELEAQLLLYHRVVETEPSMGSRQRALVRMVRMHLELDDFDAARFYARRVAALEEPVSAGVSRPLQALVALREGLAARERGRVVAGWSDALAACRALLEPTANDSPAARTLALVVDSELKQVAGDLGASRRSLEAAVVDQKTPRAVLELYHDRADALFRLLGDEAGLQEAVKKLLAASRKPEVQLEYARAWARSLVRGRPFAEQETVLARELAAAPDASEAKFSLELQRALILVRGPQSPGAIEALRAVSRAQQRPDRKRAVLLEAEERASDLGATDVLEALAQDAVVEVRPGSSDRARVEQLFSRVIMGRAYLRRFHGENALALEDFEQVARQTRSLEALVSALDLRLKAGTQPEALIAQLEGDKGMPAHLSAWGRAWVIFRGLGELSPEAQKQARERAQAVLKPAWLQLKKHRLGQALSGALKHEEFLATGDLAAAERASSHYLTGLRLMKGTPRQTPMLLGQAGLLQLAVGNYRLALAQLDEREKYPYIDNGSGLAVQLARARALLHVGRETEAAETAEEALAMTQKAPKLAQYRLLALDRAALTSLAAGKHARALELYDVELPLLAGRNALVARLARAAAALGAAQASRALEDLAVVDNALGHADVVATLRLAHQTTEQTSRTYRQIAAGLRANAHQALGQLDLAERSLERQRALGAETFAETDRDDDLRALVLAESRLADLTAARGQRDLAARWAKQALEHADQLASRTGAPIGLEQADALWLGGSLGAQAGAHLPSALAGRLRKTVENMATAQDPLWRVYQRWFEVYLALDELPPRQTP
jgi:hypothetical protein